MVYTDLVDLDYRSDECDEQTAQELYMSAFFHEFSSERVSKSGCVQELVETSERTRTDSSIVLAKKRACKGSRAKLENGGKAAGQKQRPKSKMTPQIIEESVAIGVTEPASSGEDFLHLRDNKNRMNSDNDEGLAAKYASKPKKKRKRTTRKVEQDPDVVLELDPPWKSPGWSVRLPTPIGQPRRSVQKPSLPQNSTKRRPNSLNQASEAPFGFSGKPPPEVASQEGVPLTPKVKKWRYHEASKQELWYLCEEDRFGYASFNRRYGFRNELECSNCRESGHSKYRCPLPVRNICFCCGEAHRPTRCRHLVCSTCKLAGHLSGQCPLAAQLASLRCRECNHYGHGKHAKLGSVCPDFWRRYHRTTREGPPVVPVRQPTLQPQRVFCTNCGLKGHAAVDCSSWRHDLPRPSLREVVDYDLPPRSQHKQGLWPVGNRVSIPFRQAGQGYGGKFFQNQDNGAIRNMPSVKKATKRSWGESNGRLYKQKFQNNFDDDEEDEFDKPINRRKKRRRLVKALRRQEIANVAARDGQVRKNSKFRKSRQ